MARRPTYQDVKPVEDIVTDEEAGELQAWIDTTPPLLEDLEVQARMAKLYLDRVEAISVQQSRETSVDRRKAECVASAAWKIAKEAEIRHEARLSRLKLEIAIARSKVELYRSLKANERSRNEMERYRPQPREDERRPPANGRDREGR